MGGTDQIEILLTGVGGQGIQLIAKTLALAATAAGKQVQMSANYGAEIRGGHSDASVCIATAGLDALPILPSASHAVVMHGMSWEHVSTRLRPGALAVVNENAFEGAALAGGRVVLLPVDDVAAGLGTPGAASFVLVGAFAGLTAVVTASQLQEAMQALVPPYRANLVAANRAAVEAGFALGHARIEGVVA